jgi:hypothetical protein
MDDFAMQNDRPSCRTNVRELPVVRLGHPNRAAPNDDRFSSLRVIAHQLYASGLMALRILFKWMFG